MRKIDILQHEIEFYIQDENSNNLSSTQAPLHEGDTDHIEDQIKEGYHSGELCSLQWLNDNTEPTECYGWWSIVGKGMKLGQ